MEDRVIAGYLEHEVKKIWKGIVSCGDYTVRKCKQLRVGLRLCYRNEDGVWLKMSIPYDMIDKKIFKLHDQTIKSKYGRDYKMVDFGWKPDKQED